MPSLDTCDTCDKFALDQKHASTEEKEAIKALHEEHLKDADLRYNKKAEDKVRSQISDTKEES